jgi:hypothetical protein
VAGVSPGATCSGPGQTGKGVMSSLQSAGETERAQSACYTDRPRRSGCRSAVLSSCRTLTVLCANHEASVPDLEPSNTSIYMSRLKLDDSVHRRYMPADYFSSEVESRYD